MLAVTLKSNFMNLIRLILIFLLANVAYGQNKSTPTKTHLPHFVNQTNIYIDSVKHFNFDDTIFKACGGVNLEYYLINKKIIKVIEVSAGYKRISSTQTYYFKNDSILFIDGDMEIAPEDTKYNILELQKIYFKNEKVSYYLFSTQNFYPEKIFKNDSDIERTSKGLRLKAKFIKSKIADDVEKKIYEGIPIYKKVMNLPDNDKALQQIYSPFI